MYHDKCCEGERSKKLCPVSFGLSVGLVSFFAVLIWSLWIMHYGMPPMMIELRMPAPTLGGAFGHALLALFKGFIFGFFVALFYDLFSCCKFRRKSCQNNKCQCENCKCDKCQCGSSPSQIK